MAAAAWLSRRSWPGPLPDDPPPSAA